MDADGDGASPLVPHWSWPRGGYYSRSALFRCREPTLGKIHPIRRQQCFLLVPSAASPKYPTGQWSFCVRRLPNNENENDERVLRQPVWILFGSSDCCEGSVRMDDERWNLHQPGSARASGCRKYLHVTEIGAFETTSTNTFRMWKNLLKKYCCSKRVIYCCGSVLTSRKTTDICWLKQHRPNLPTGTICICKDRHWGSAAQCFVFRRTLPWQMVDYFQQGWVSRFTALGHARRWRTRKVMVTGTRTKGSTAIGWYPDWMVVCVYQ